MNKRGQVEMLVEFVLAVVLLTIIYLVLKVGIAVGAKPTADFTAAIESPSSSFACDYWLMNFLRAKSPEGVPFAELLSLAEKNSDFKAKFEKQTEDWFNDNYKRGISQKRSWFLKAETSAFIPITDAGTLEATDPLDTCFQIIPGIGEGNIKVKLGVEY